MRLSFLATILPIALSLASLAAARGYDSGLSYEARDYVDELATRETLSELTTRELIGELSNRLERRGEFMCQYCLAPWIGPMAGKCPKGPWKQHKLTTIHKTGPVGDK